MVALIEMPGARATLSPRADRPQPEQLALVGGAPSSVAEEAPRRLDAAGEASFLPGDLTMRTLHTSYRVSNLAASLGFYTALGYEQVGRVDLGDNASLTMLKFPGEEVVTLELVHRPEDEPVDYRHRVQSHSSPGRRSRCQAWAVIGGEAHRLRRHLAKSLGNCRQVATTP